MQISRAARGLMTLVARARCCAAPRRAALRCCALITISSFNGAHHFFGERRCFPFGFLFFARARARCMKCVLLLYRCAKKEREPGGERGEREKRGRGEREKRSVNDGRDDEERRNEEEEEEEDVVPDTSKT